MTHYDPSAAAVAATEKEFGNDDCTWVSEDGTHSKTVGSIRVWLRAALVAAHAAGEAGKEAEYERGKRDAYLNMLADATGGLMDAAMARAPWDLEEEIRDKARRHGVKGAEFDL